MLPPQVILLICFLPRTDRKTSFFILPLSTDWRFKHFKPKLRLRRHMMYSRRGYGYVSSIEKADTIKI